jgi:hypothetical protein
MIMNRFSRPALLLACLTLTSALPCAAIAQDNKAISKTAAAGNWVEANGVATAFSSTQSGSAPPSATAQVSLSFNQPVATDMLHATMNGAGARGLALVEVQDTKGDWHKAWEGKMTPPARGFEQTCFEQKLPQKQTVQALRFGFRPGPEQIDLNHAALLRR